MYLHNITPPLKVCQYGKRRVNTGSKYKEDECSLNARHTQLFGLCIYPYWVLNSCVQGKEFQKYPPHVAMSPTKNKTLKNTPKIYSFLVRCYILVSYKLHPMSTWKANMWEIIVLCMKASVTEKKGNDDVGMEISKHLEYKCNKICSNFQVAKRRLLQVLFLHLNPSGHQTLLF